MAKKITTEEFIERAKKVHGDRYDYSESEYINSSKKVKIICNQHGVFHQSPNCHVNAKQGCKKCSSASAHKKQALTTESFIEKSQKIHGDKFDYKLVNYISAREKVKIICKEHGIYLQVAAYHLSGNGCPACAKEETAHKKKKSTEQFIIDAKKKHGDKFDYSLVEYEHVNKEVVIVCPRHGEFLQKPTNHLRGGCYKCSFNKKVRVNKKDKFLKSLNKIFLEMYDYTDTIYKNLQTEITYFCKKHKQVVQKAWHHKKYGCPKCKKNNKITTEIFIKKCREIHRNKYDYSKTIYLNCKAKVCILCPKHGEFYQPPSCHYKHGCKSCAAEARGMNQKCDTKNFIKKANKVHNQKYIYDLTDYKNSKHKIDIICKLHGAFSQIPEVHLSGGGCPECSKESYRKKRGIGFDDFVKRSKEIHENKYSYDMAVYEDVKKPICILCPIHGKFYQKPSLHIRGSGCQKCNSSKGERKIRKFLNKNNIKFIEQERVSFGKNRHMVFDFYIKPCNMVIEYDGEQHFKPINRWGGEQSLKMIQRRDSEKNKYCLTNNINLLRIPYTEFDNIEEILTKELNLK